MSYEFNVNGKKMEITRLTRKKNIVGHKTKEYLMDIPNKKYISSIFTNDKGKEFFEYQGIYYILDNTIKPVE